MSNTLQNYVYWRGRHEKKIRDIISYFKSNRQLADDERARRFAKRKVTCPKCNNPPAASFVETDEYYEAKCRATKSCFHIRVKKEPKTNVFFILDELERELSVQTTALIRLHMDALYGVEKLDAAEEKYNDIRKSLYALKKKYDKAITVYDSFVQKKRFETEINQKETQLFEYVSELQEIIANTPERSKNNAYDQANQIYVDNIAPLARQIADLKHPVRVPYIQNDSNGFVSSVTMKHLSHDPLNLEVNIT